MHFNENEIGKKIKKQRNISMRKKEIDIDPH